MRQYLAALLLATPSLAPAQDELPYAPEQDAKTAHAAALAKAKVENKHVWIQIGEPDCPACRRLHWFIEAHPETSEPLRRHFISLHVAISRQNIPLFRQWNSPQLEHGVPVILVLDAQGEILAISPAKAFAARVGEFSEEKIAAFIQRWAPGATQAEPVKER